MIEFNLNQSLFVKVLFGEVRNLREKFDIENKI